MISLCFILLIPLRTSLFYFSACNVAELLIPSHTGIVHVGTNSSSSTVPDGATLQVIRYLCILLIKLFHIQKSGKNNYDVINIKEKMQNFIVKGNLSAFLDKTLMEK